MTTFNEIIDENINIDNRKVTTICQEIKSMNLDRN